MILHFTAPSPPLQTSLGPLVQHVKHHQVIYIVETLCKNMTCEKDQLRDISSIGLKTVITDLPKSSPELITIVCDNITPCCCAR